MSLTFDWPRSHLFETATGVIKEQNDDFVVIEKLPETPSGEGEHLWVTLEKNGQNTAWVARQLANWAGLKPRDVSYAGLKDRHAVTQQTFSVHLPGKVTPSPHLIHIDGVKLISYARHSRKLKTGQLIGNQFKIRVRHSDIAPDILQANWSQVCAMGVPNYFGPQRFGHHGQNVQQGMDWLLGKTKAPRHHQSIYLSAVRSYLFNQLLAARVQQGTWNQLMPADFVQFSEGKTGFYCEQPDDNDLSRCLAGQLSPCASLPGESKESFSDLDQREDTLLSEFSPILTALREKRVMRHFRKLRVIPEQTSFDIIDGDPVFTFFLPAGSYATSVLKELVAVQDNQEAKDWHE